MKVKAGSGHA